MSELGSVLSGRGNELLAFKLISSLTGLMVKQSSSITVSPPGCPGPERLHLVSAPRVVRLTAPFLDLCQSFNEPFLSASVLYVFSDFLLCSVH